MRGVWTSANHVTIDESMINYMGRAISYVHYIPAKLINNGINLFAVCCALSKILLGFKVCICQEDDSYNTSLGISDELVKEAGLTIAREQTLCTDTYYMSMVIAKHMFNNYAWTLVGTIIPTDKKSHAYHDIPFLRL